MATIDKDIANGLAKMTNVNSGGHHDDQKFIGEFVFGVDAFPPALNKKSAMREQDIDGAYGRALNTGRGVVGEGDGAGPGVVGIAACAAYLGLGDNRSNGTRFSLLRGRGLLFLPARLEPHVKAGPVQVNKS